MPDWSFYRHMPVYLRSGRLLGRTEEIGHAVDFLHVQQGRLLIRDWYLPITAVRDVTAQGVYLGVDLGHLRRNRWNVPPEAYLSRQGATPGYEYTSQTDIPSYGDTELGSPSTT
jgi:hypothetical protein